MSNFVYYDMNYVLHHVLKDYFEKYFFIVIFVCMYNTDKHFGSQFIIYRAMKYNPQCLTWLYL